MTDNKSVWLCCRVADFKYPMPGSKTSKCSSCHEKVWYDPRLTKQAGKCKKMCVQCLEKLFNEENKKGAL